jgi:uncharacterized protein (TIGR00369 family)
MEGFAAYDLGEPIEAGEWAGWRKWNGDEPFEDHAGPFYARREEGGRMAAAFRVERKHLNGAGSVHGGALMAFADYSLFQIAYDHWRGMECVTVSLGSEFLSGAAEGALLTARGDILKTGKNLLFVRGLIDHEGTPILNFSGIIRVFRT